MSEIGVGARVNHPSFGEGVITGADLEYFQIFFRNVGDKEISRQFQGLEVVKPALQQGEGNSSLSLQAIEKALRNVIVDFIERPGPVKMAGKWMGGKLIMEPGEEGLQEKEIPIDTFFHKIVMVRDRLRVLEQKINHNNNLTDEEKVDLQQYITRIYGSLTTFNVLFAQKEDHFKGEGGKRD